MVKTLQKNSAYNDLDSNNDGIVDDSEIRQAEKLIEMQQQQIIFENEDKKQDAQRNMAWFALGGMLFYPFAVVLATYFKLDSAAKILGDMAATYFVSVAAIIAAFYGKEAFASRNSTPSAPTYERQAPRPSMDRLPKEL
tara:strand:+ start:3760 stop:4176 length:417 start_codon:yes stop_codon:yes gene_type:complete